MAKHPVPKKKTNKSDSKRRYGSFKTKVLKKLSNAVNLVPCPSCGEKRLLHTACSNCGQYRGRQVIVKKQKIDRITKIKA